MNLKELSEALAAKGVIASADQGINFYAEFDLTVDAKALTWETEIDPDVVDYLLNN